MRDYLIIAAEFRQAVRDLDDADRAVAQAESTWRLMRERRDRAAFVESKVSEELRGSARA